MAIATSLADPDIKIYSVLLWNISPEKNGQALVRGFGRSVRTVDDSPSA